MSESGNVRGPTWFLFVLLGLWAGSGALGERI